MYNSIPKSKVWLTINYVVNVVGIIMPWLYIFRGERIQICKPGTYMAMQRKAWMITFFFKEFVSF